VIVFRLVCITFAFNLTNKDKIMEATQTAEIETAAMVLPAELTEMAQDATVIEILARFEAFKKWAANVIEIS